MHKLPPIYRNVASVAAVALLLVIRFIPYELVAYATLIPISWFVTSAVLLVLLLVIRYVLWKKKRLRLLSVLNSYDVYDILELWKYRLVLPRATGQSITHIDAEVQNLTGKRLQVIMHPGTYFVSSGDHQNMVTCDEHYFVLRKQGTERFSVSAACINAERPIPGNNDYFEGVAKVSNNLIRFLKGGRGEDSKVIQAGVWAITDRYSKQEIQRKLTVHTSQGNMPAISDYQIERAKQILNRLKIWTKLNKWWIWF